MYHVHQAQIVQHVYQDTFQKMEFVLDVILHVKHVILLKLLVSHAMLEDI